MTGAMLKTWYAEKHGIDPKNIVSVSIMPCTAKKFEIDREDQDAAGDGIQDVDIVLTTREIGRLLKQCNIDFANLPDEEFDPAMGVSTGAGAIFGATGGVMEALRTAADTIFGAPLENIEYHEVRGTQDYKEATYNLNGLEVKVAVVSGLENANTLLEKVRSGEADCQFIEIMCCPGGCVNGGGQPIQPAEVRNFTDLKSLRAKALYEEDKNLPFRKSHESPIIKQVYQEYLEEPGSHIAHQILHTTFVKRNKTVQL